MAKISNLYPSVFELLRGMVPMLPYFRKLRYQRLALVSIVAIVSFLILNILLLGSDVIPRLSRHSKYNDSYFFTGNSSDKRYMFRHRGQEVAGRVERIGRFVTGSDFLFRGSNRGQYDGKGVGNALEERELSDYERALPKLRVVHLDLKGAPPKLSFLRGFFSLISASGANAVLIEYEDMFPYEGVLKNATAGNAYSKSDVLTILKWAKENNLDVIPLVQTFGHLEFVLKLQEFKHLRELTMFPQEICPSNPEGFQLVKEMVRQVMLLHSESKYLHIGCDEVFHLAACSKCYDRIRELNADKNGNEERKDGRYIFMDHVKKVATHVKSEYHVQPIVWDDMFRQTFRRELQESGLGKLVEPMVWVYIEDITRLVPPYIWQMYSEVFPNIWVAGAFKGAFGETAFIPDIKRHFDNNVAWVDLMRQEVRKVKNFRGIVLTGWSRYDHFAVLCELLPPAIPSLLLNLLYVSSRGDMDKAFEDWTELLSCPRTFPRVTKDKLLVDQYQWLLQSCSFPGNNLFSAMRKYASYKFEVENLVQDLTVNQGWMTPYNVKHQFSSPWRVAEGLKKQPFLMNMLRDFRNSTERILTQYYDIHTANEWLEQKVDPLLDKILYVQNIAQTLMNKDTWPRRPLN